LPGGVTIDSISGDITGTPNETGSFSVIVTATDSVDPTYQISTASFTFSVSSGGGDNPDNPTWVMQPTFNSEYELNDNINVPAEAESSPAANGVDYSATGLPDGVTIDSISGDITGTFQMVGNYSVIITATDSVEPTYQISTSSFAIDVIEYDENGVDNLDEGTIDGNPSWNIINLNYINHINDNILASFSIENLLDTHYKTFGSGISASGRNFVVSLTSKF